MKTQTYTYNSKKVIIENGVVIFSEFEHCKVGEKPNLKALRACGWLKQRQPVVYFAHGTRNSNRFTN